MCRTAAHLFTCLCIVSLLGAYGETAQTVDHTDSISRLEEITHDTLIHSVQNAGQGQQLDTLTATLIYDVPGKRATMITSILNNDNVRAEVDAVGSNEAQVVIGSCEPHANITLVLSGSGHHTITFDDPAKTLCHIQVLPKSPENAVRYALSVELPGNAALENKALQTAGRTLLNLSHMWEFLTTLTLKGTKGDTLFVQGTDTRTPSNKLRVVLSGDFEKAVIKDISNIIEISGELKETTLDLRNNEQPLSIHMNKNCVNVGTNQENYLTDDSNDCTILITNKESHLSIFTGKEADRFTGVGVSVPVDVDLGEGDNTVHWMDSDDVALHVKLGTGSDTVKLSETGTVTVDMSAGSASDTVVIVPKETRTPDLLGSLITPTGKFTDSYVRLVGQKRQDVVRVERMEYPNTLKHKRDFKERNVVHVNASTPGLTVYYSQENDTTYMVDECAAQAHISFDSGSSEPTHDYAHNAWVYVALPDVSVPCFVFVNSRNNLENVMGIRLPKGGLLPQEILLRETDSPQGSGFIEAGKVELRGVQIQHVEVSIPETDASGVIEVENTPCSADLFISVPSNKWTVNIAKQRTNIIVLNGNTSVTGDAIISDFGIVAAGTSGQSTVYLDTINYGSVRMVAGCVNFDGLVSAYTLSPWMLERALEHDTKLETTRSCHVEMLNVTHLHVTSMADIELGGLYRGFVDHVTVATDSTLEVVVDPQLQDGDKISGYKRWEHGTFRDMSMDIVFADGSSAIVEYRAKDARTVMLGHPLFTNTSHIDINTGNATVPLTLNLAGTVPSGARMLGLVEFSSAKCKGAVNNFITEDGNVLPVVRIAPEMEHCTVIAKFANASSSLFSGGAAAISRNVNFSFHDPYARGMLSGNMTRLYIEEFVEDPKNTSVQVPADFQGAWDEDALEALGTDRTGHFQRRIDVTWAFGATDGMVVALEDWSENAVDIDEAILADYTMDVRIGSAAALSFNRLAATLLFTNVTASDFDAANQTFVLRAGGEGYCFDPCRDCTRREWDKIKFADRKCRSRLDEVECLRAVRVRINSTGAVGRVACGAPAWDARFAGAGTGESENASGTNCTFAVNSAGAPLRTDDFPRWVTRTATVVVALALGLTVVGASALAGVVGWCWARPVRLGDWWARTVFRDAQTDQFSWAAIAVSAVLTEVDDADYSRWGGPVAALLLQLKRVVLDGLRPCGPSGEPQWTAWPVYVFWGAAFGCVALRAVRAVLRRKHTPRALADVVAAVHGWATAAGLVLLPLVGHTLAFQRLDTVAGYGAMACTAALVLCQPPGEAGRARAVGAAATALAALAPMALCIAAGVRTHFAVAFWLGVAVAVLVPAAGTAALWTTHFRHASIRSRAWRLGLALTVALRALGAGCGVAFYVLVRGTLGARGSLAAVVLWLAWVALPWLAVVPLTLSVNTVLTGARPAALHRRPVRDSLYARAPGDSTLFQHDPALDGNDGYNGDNDDGLAPAADDETQRPLLAAEQAPLPVAPGGSRAWGPGPDDTDPLAAGSVHHHGSPSSTL